jgi:crotonobetainyl-CoA:carnitine CoA-transferase CaiB-like acyl-CoA transferase
VLDLPDLPDDPRFGRNQDRTANREQLRPILLERLATRTKDEWFRDLIAAGVPCAPINTIDGGVAFAEELGLDPVVTAGGIPGIRNPITFSDSRARYELPPPGLDEHGEEIRKWLRS